MPDETAQTETTQTETAQTETTSVEQDTTPDTQTTAEDTAVTEPSQPEEQDKTQQQDSQQPETPGDKQQSQDPQQPEWFMADKYKSVEEQAKAAYELQKKMGKFWGPPEQDYNTEEIEGIKSDDPLVKNLAPALKEIGLSQEGFQHLVKQYQDANIKMMKGFEEELKKELTENDAATYRAVDKWMQDNFTAEEREQVQNNWLMTPADFKLFNNLRLMAAPNTSVPSSTSENAQRFESSTEVENDKIKYRKEVNQKLRVPDKNYEAELAQRFRDAKAREMRAQQTGKK